MQTTKPRFFLVPLLLLGVGAFLAGCGGQDTAVTGTQDNKGAAGPSGSAKAYELKAQDGGAIPVDPGDGSKIKIVFPQDALAKDSTVEVSALSKTGDDVLSSGFSLVEKGSGQGPELKYPALISITAEKDLGPDVSIVRYRDDGSYVAIPTKVSVKDGKTVLFAQVSHFSDYGGRKITPAEKDTAESQDMKDFNWVIYSKDSYDIDAGAMKRKVTLDFKAVNTSGDIAGEYKGYAHASTANKMEEGGGRVTADSKVGDDNVSFVLGPYIELADLVERDDGLAELEPEKMPDFIGQGSLNMRGGGSGTVSAAGRTYAAGLKVQDSQDVMSVVVTGPLVRLTVAVNGIGTMYFDGYIRGEGK